MITLPSAGENLFQYTSIISRERLMFLIYPVPCDSYYAVGLLFVHVV